MTDKEKIRAELEEAARNYGDELDNVLSVGVDDDNSIGEYATQAFKAGAQWQRQQDMKYGYITALQGEKQFARYILEMIANGWHIEAIKTACNDKMKEEEQ